MSYPPPPGGPGSANPYGQQPQQGGWPQQQGQVPGPPAPPTPPGMPPVGPPAPQGTSGEAGRTIRTVVGAALGLLGVLVLVGGGLLAGHAYSNSQQSIPNHEYGDVIWSDEPVDDIFPPTIGSRENKLGSLTNPKHASWRRLGISPDTSCGKGLNGETLKSAKKFGCEAVLRATYVDPTGNALATVAVVVLPGESKKLQMAQAFEDLDGSEGAVVPFAVPDTLAARWTYQRNGAAVEPAPDKHLPYAVAATTGAVDGRIAGNLPGEWGKDDYDGRSDRESWVADAENLVKLFQLHLTDLQLGGAK